MVLLMLWGIFDLVFYNGDILTVYAACGWLLIPFIRSSNKVLTIIAFILILQPVELVYLILGLINPEMQPLNLGSGVLFRALLPYQMEGSFFEMAWAGIKYGFPINFLWAIENGRFTQTLFLFFLGILMGRHRFFYDEGNNRTLWKKIIIYSVIAFAILYRE